MSFGNARKQNNLKAYAFKIRTKDLAVPHFEVSVRQDEKWAPLTKETTVDGKTITEVETAQNVEGNLIAIESRKTNYQGKTIKSTNVTLQDGNEIDFITVPNSMLGRSVLNSLFNLKSYDDIRINLWATRPKTEGGKSYPNASVYQAGERVDWKYKIEELPKPTELRKESGELVARDFDKLDAFFEEKVKELNERLKKRSVVTPAPAAVEDATQHATPATTEAEKPVEDDGIPF